MAPWILYIYIYIPSTILYVLVRVHLPKQVWKKFNKKVSMWIYFFKTYKNQVDIQNQIIEFNVKPNLKNNWD